MIAASTRGGNTHDLCRQIDRPAEKGGLVAGGACAAAECLAAVRIEVGGRAVRARSRQDRPAQPHFRRQHGLLIKGRAGGAGVCAQPFRRAFTPPREPGGGFVLSGAAPRCRAEAGAGHVFVRDLAHPADFARRTERIHRPRHGKRGCGHRSERADRAGRHSGRHFSDARSCASCPSCRCL